MGLARAHIPVKLIVGLISCRLTHFDAAKNVLKRKYGDIDGETEPLDFSCTRYYAEELGENLKRKFLSFRSLIPLDRQCRIKLFTNKLEKKFSCRLKRAINIDPGYVSLTKLVLFTTKPRSHRIYIESGIYADIELLFSDKTFHPVEWSYPDFKTKGYIDFFNSVRATYSNQIKPLL
ncbi:MAG: DUF4416 family protein [Candidatus Omnitrophica bacterium]|nr:DUF4416 family protein [Candidatus Omnitrophota bacterium]